MKFIYMISTAISLLALVNALPVSDSLDKRTFGKGDGCGGRGLFKFFGGKRCDESVPPPSLVCQCPLGVPTHPNTYYKRGLEHLFGGIGGQGSGSPPVECACPPLSNTPPPTVITPPPTVIVPPSPTVVIVPPIPTVTSVPPNPYVVPPPNPYVAPPPSAYK